MDTEFYKSVTDCLRRLIEDNQLHSCTAFLSPLSNVKKRIRMTKAKNGNGFHLDIGKPNYKERKFLQLCKKAKTKPRKFLLQFFVKKKK
jgi:hypothetical protein